MAEEQKGTIDSSIEVLEKYIESNRRSGAQIMMFLVAITTILFVSAVFYINVSNQPDLFLYALVGVFVVVFGVLMAIYRFHLNEIAKAEHNKLAFMRIRVAANNYDREGFHSEVRQSLTERAFDYSLPSLIGGRGKNIESPLPGHPTSDASAMIINKLLEGLEVRKKQ